MSCSWSPRVSECHNSRSTLLVLAYTSTCSVSRRPLRFHLQFSYTLICFALNLSVCTHTDQCLTCWNCLLRVHGMHGCLETNVHRKEKSELWKIRALKNQSSEKSELRSRVKVQMAALGSPSLRVVLMVSVDVNNTDLNWKIPLLWLVSTRHRKLLILSKRQTKAPASNPCQLVYYACNTAKVIATLKNWNHLPTAHVPFVTACALHRPAVTAWTNPSTVNNIQGDFYRSIITERKHLGHIQPLCIQITTNWRSESQTEDMAKTHSAENCPGSSITTSVLTSQMSNWQIKTKIF